MRKVVVLAGWICFALLAIRFAIVPLLVIAVDNNAEVECLKLQLYSKNNELFELARWEEMMCDSVGIEIDAPARNHYEKQN